jgi:hypothetical protein
MYVPPADELAAMTPDVLVDVLVNFAFTIRKHDRHGPASEWDAIDRMRDAVYAAAPRATGEARRLLRVAAAFVGPKL